MFRSAVSPDLVAYKRVLMRLELLADALVSQSSYDSKFPFLSRLLAVAAETFYFREIFGEKENRSWRILSYETNIDRPYRRFLNAQNTEKPNIFDLWLRRRQLTVRSIPLHMATRFCVFVKMSTFFDIFFFCYFVTNKY